MHMKQSIFTRDLWAVSAFRVLARIVAVFLAATYLHRSIGGFISGTVIGGYHQYQGVDAYLYCAWYAVFAVLLLCFALTPPRFWMRSVFVWPALSFGFLFAMLAIAIAVHVSTH